MLKKKIALSAGLLFSTFFGSSIVSADELAVDSYLEVSSYEVDQIGWTEQDHEFKPSSTPMIYWKLKNFNPSGWNKSAYSVSITETDSIHDKLVARVRTYDTNGREDDYTRKYRDSNTYVEAKAYSVSNPSKEYSKSWHEFYKASRYTEKSLTNTKWP